MTHLRNLVAVGATAAIVALGQNVLAQDDLLAGTMNQLETFAAATPAIPQDDSLLSQVGGMLA